MWLSQDKCLSSNIPRYLMLLTGVNFLPSNLIEISLSNKWRLDLKIMSSVLPAFRDSRFYLCQFDTRFNSVLTMVSIVLRFLLLYRIYVTSAKCPDNVFLRQKWKSLMYMRNSSGPREEPCGTPQVISFISES